MDDDRAAKNHTMEHNRSENQALLLLLLGVFVLQYCTALHGSARHSTNPPMPSVELLVHRVPIAKNVSDEFVTIMAFISAKEHLDDSHRRRHAGPSSSMLVNE